MANPQVTIQGTVYRMMPMVSNGQYASREMVVKTSEDYNGKTYENYILVVASNKAMDKLDHVSVGDEVNVTANVKGVRYADKKTGEEKFFCKNELWNISKSGSAPKAAAPKKQAETFVVPNQVHDDGLPF